MARCNVALGKFLEASDNIDAGYDINKVKTEAQILDPKDRGNYYAVYKTAAFALLEEKKFDEALKKAERARYLDSTRAESYVLIGLVWSQRKDPVKMQAAFARAQQLDPAAPEPYLYLGHRFYDETKWDSALFYYEKAIELFAKKRDNALKTIMAKTPALKPDEVAAKLVALQLGTKQVELDEYVKKTLLREGGVREISRPLESVINAHINLTVAYFRAAACAYNSSKIDKAAAHFENLLKLEPDNRDGLYYYGQVLVTKLQFAKAAEVFGKLVKLDAKDKESLFSLGYAYLKMNDFDKVIETLEDKYLALDPNNANVYINLGLAYKGKGNAKKAYEYIKKAEELERNKPKK
jgi:tetratricopeptide (TPR) repeat protein